MAKPRKIQKPKKSDVALHRPIKLDTGLLDFDTNNPRFAVADAASNKEADIVRQLCEGADIAELLQSIASNGYIDIEPLIVMPAGKRFVVLEGNRRLAAIRLL